MFKQYSSIVFIGIKGTVLALNKLTGQEIWRTKLKGSSFVNLVFENDTIYATTQGAIFCLDPQTGNIRWNNNLKGMGYGIVTIASSSSSQVSSAQESMASQRAAASTAGST